MKSKPIKVISLPVDDGGCGNYRIRQPFEMIMRFTKSDVHIIDAKKDDMVDVVKAMDAADVISIRQGAERGMYELREKPEFKDKPWVMDIDDNVELIDPYSSHYKEYGVSEVKHKGKWLWQDGDTIDLALNRQRMKWHLWGLKNASLVTVTTDKLAEYVRQYNPNVRVLPNCINFERWWKLPLKPNKQLRVIWSGGISHYQDWFAIKKPLNDMMRKHQFKLIMVGADFKGIVDKDNEHLVELEDWMPFKGHSYRMMCMNADIAVIPLADMEFNTFKSSIKWYEMSAMGIPTLVSNILPYSKDITDGETALCYRTGKEFADALLALLEDPALRKNIGNNANKWVKKHMDAKKNVNKWVNAYKSIL